MFWNVLLEYSEVVSAINHLVEDGSCRVLYWFVVVA